MDNERDLRFRGNRQIEPVIEAERVHARETVDLRLSLRSRTQAIAVLLRDPLEAHDSPGNRSGRDQILAIHVLSIAAGVSDPVIVLERG